jgi:hypothetical protein
LVWKYTTLEYFVEHSFYWVAIVQKTYIQTSGFESLETINIYVAWVSHDVSMFPYT